MEILLQGLRSGFRTMLRNRAFTTVAFALALSIGANSTIHIPANSIDWMDQNQSFAMDMANAGFAQSCTQTLTGPPPNPGRGLSLSGSMQTNVWSFGAGGNRWEDIRLGDVDANGFDDVCGFYGNSYGCSRRLSNLWFEGFLEACGFAGWRDIASMASTIRAVDVTGDGRADLCGRGPDGVICQTSTGSGFNGPTIWASVFSDRNGWNRPEYYSTIGFARLEAVGGSAIGICGRGIAGVHCYFHNSTNTGFLSSGILASEFSDANFWNQEQYYSTIHYVDVTGDGFDDICARGVDGIWCARYNHLSRSFDPATLWTTQFSDADGWGNPVYYRSIRFGDINGDGVADVCGRGIAGVYCGIADTYFGVFAHATRLAVPELSDNAGFASRFIYYSSLQLTDINGDNRADVCAVGPWYTTTSGGQPIERDEIYCALSRSAFTPVFDPATRRTSLASMMGSPPRAGRLYSSMSGAFYPTMSFCYAQIGDVTCTNPWY